MIDEFVLRGNSATLKCLVPSFITEFVDIEAWVSSEDEEFLQKNQSIGIGTYSNENIKFLLSFITSSQADPFLSFAVLKIVGIFLMIKSPPGLDIVFFFFFLNFIISSVPLSVVNQYFESQVYDVFVIRGNSAIFKCQIPSFVTDHVEITEWQDTEGGHYNISDSDLSGR